MVHSVIEILSFSMRKYFYPCKNKGQIDRKYKICMRLCGLQSLSNLLAETSHLHGIFHVLTDLQTWKQSPTPDLNQDSPPVSPQPQTPDSETLFYHTPS